MHNFKILYRKSLGGHACLQFRSYATRKTHYQVLGVKKTATQQEIKNAYIQLSKKHHPDTAGSGSKQTFTEINEAYSVLSKPLSRKEYDNQLAFSAAQNASSSYYRPHRGPQGSRPTGYPNDQYQQRQNERTYQSQESSTYSDFHRKREAFNRIRVQQKQYEQRERMYREFEQRMYKARSRLQDGLVLFLEIYLMTAFFGLFLMTFYAMFGLKYRRPPRRTKWDLFPLETKVMAALLVIITLIKVIGWAVTQIPRSCTPIIRRIEMYAQSELHGKYYDFYERYEREQGESAKGKNGLTANFIVMAGLLFALMISITRFTLGMMLQSIHRNRFETNDACRVDVSDSTSMSYVVLGLLFLLILSTGFVFHKASWHQSYIKKLNKNADPHLQRSPSDEVKRKMDRETRERRRAMEIEKDITPPKA